MRDGKGAKDRTTRLPKSLAETLKNHLATVKQTRQENLRRGLGRVEMPFALTRKYPNAEKMELAIRFPLESFKQKSAHRLKRQTSPFAFGFAESFQKRSGKKPYCKKRPPARSAPFVRHAPASRRLRHSHRSGTSRIQGTLDDNDLHARLGQNRLGVKSPADC